MGVFVANRVSEIQSSSNINQWHYVSTLTNPADLISRGQNPEQLVNNHLWWFGPAWLRQPQELWPSNNVPQVLSDECRAEMRKTAVTLVVTPNKLDIFNKFSSFLKLQRICAYILRFGHNALKKDPRFSGPLSVFELNQALDVLIRVVQGNHSLQK